MRIHPLITIPQIRIPPISSEKTIRALPLIATFGAYINSFQGSFQYDDFKVIVDNPLVHTWGGFWADATGIRPLLKATYTLNWTSGMGIAGFHLLNLFLHILNTALIQRLSARLFCAAMGLDKAEAEKAALFTAFLFALHPVQTESVTYICGRSMSLMAVFYLGAVAAYDHGRMHKNVTWTLCVSPTLFLLAIAAKEIAVTLPAALLLWELSVYSRVLDWRRAMRAQALHILVLSAFLIVLLTHSGYSSLLTYGFNERSSYHNLLSQINGVFYLIRHIFSPGDINIDPDLPTVTSWNADITLKATALATLLGVGIVSIRRRPLIAFGVIWFFLSLLPSNSIIPRIDIANDRHLYLACWGLFLVAGAYFAMFSRKYPRVAKVAFIVLPMALGGITYARNQAFYSEIALWEDTVKKSPHKARSYNNLGYSYALVGRYREARDAYLQAITLKPDYTKAILNLRELEINMPNSSRITSLRKESSKT